MLPYSEAMGPEDVNTCMRNSWDISPVSRETIFSWAWRNARSNLWSKYCFWKSRLSIGDNERTIETGCGHGKFSLALGLSGAQVTLLDYNAAAVSAAVEVHRKIGLEPRAIHGDLLNLPENLLGAFDVVCSFGTLEHFAGEDRRRVFAACASLLRPGGLLFFTVPNRYGIAYRLAFGTRRRLGLVPRNFYEQPYSRTELFSISKACEMNIAEIEGIAPLAKDFDDWIGGNFRSLLRKLGIGWRHQPDQTPPEPEVIIERLKFSPIQSASLRCLCLPPAAWRTLVLYGSKSIRNCLPTCLRNPQTTRFGSTQFLRAALQPH